MYVAMNRFRIAREREENSETLWRDRDSNLEGVPEFRSFDLLRGPEDEECTLYASASSCVAGETSPTFRRLR